MSHFTTIRTRIVEREHLLKALDDAGLRYEVGDLTIRGDLLGSVKVEVRVSPGGFLSRAIGFRKTKDTYDCVADWSGVRGVKREAFVQQLNQRYAYHAAVAKLAAQGFVLADEQQEEGGKIHLVLRRTA